MKAYALTPAQMMATALLATIAKAAPASQTMQMARPAPKTAHARAGIANALTQHAQRQYAALLTVSADTTQTETTAATVTLNTATMTLMTAAAHYTLVTERMAAYFI
jgi:hypothetical protein